MSKSDDGRQKASPDGVAVVDHTPTFDRRRSGPKLSRRLIERDDWLKELTATFSGTTPPHAVVIEGGPGLGKTGLLNAACYLADEIGLDVVRARGSSRETPSSFGVARQLLQSDPRNVAFTDESLPMGEWTPSHSLDAADMHRFFGELFDNFARRAAETPLLVAVDDLQWADHESVSWLHYLSRRLHSGNIWFVGAATPRVAGLGLRAVDSIVAEPSTRVFTLRNLTQESVAQMVGRHHRDARFAETCYELTRGNPFLLVSLLSYLEHDGAHLEITKEEARNLAPPPVARAILRRLDGFPPEVHSFLEAAAVLGDGIDHRIAAELSGVDPDNASNFADALAEVHILRDTRPLRFVYPLERSTVCGEMGHARRARAHARAARLLEAHGAPLNDVAGHLLLTEPSGDESTALTLERVARQYAETEQWILAAPYFVRALAEPPHPDHRPGLLVALASVQAALGESTSMHQLREAVDLGADPTALAQAALGCVKTFSEESLPAEAVATFHLIAARLGGEEHDLRLRLEVAVATRSANPSTVPMMTSNFESALVKKGTGWTRPERLAMAHLSYTHSFDPARGSASYVAAMAEQAVDPHDLSFDDPFSIAVTARAISTLIRAGRFDISQRLTRTALAIAQKSNLTMATAEFSTVLAHSLVAQGSLPEAEDESRRALHAAADRPWQSRPMCLAILATALIDQGRPREAAAFLDGDPSITTPKTFADLAPLEERARLRLAEGRLDEALSDLRIVRQWAETRGVRNPALTYWRFLAASALHENGRLTEAHDLAKRTVEDARTFGALWCLGAALRVAAKTSDSATERLALLTEANRVLEPSGALLEHARVSIDLGEALREDAQDAGARSALRRAADLAFRCRAQPLTDRAERALRAAGARPRRLALVGSDALTPAERRVAELAASGKNNGGIAKLLFISEKTVEGHLSRCYQKLGIRSRAELQEILDPVPAESLDAADKPSSRALGLVSLPKGNNGTPANPQRLREDA